MRTGKSQFQVSILVCLILSIALNLTEAFGAIINVPTPGYPTIQAGIDAAVDGDTVFVADGTYTGDGNKDLDFKGKAITVISGNGPYATIIDCKGEGRGFYFHTGEGQDSVVAGFTITNGKSTGIDGAGIDISFSSPVVRNNVISNNQGWGISTRGVSNPLIQENIIHDNSGGIEIWASQPNITGNVIKNNSGYGIETANTRAFNILNNIIAENGNNGVDFGIPSGSSGSVVIINNTIVANSGNGISGNRDSAVTISNNIVTNNGDCGVFFETSYDWGIPNSNYNDVWDNSDGNYCELAASGTDDISADPLFVDSANGDYHLWPNSPCVDAGTSDGAPGTDFEGDSRPIDGNADDIAQFDIGADEAGVLLDHDITVKTGLPQIVPVKLGTNFTPEAKVTNLGLQDENGFTFTCEIRQNSTIIYSDTQNLSHLDSMDLLDVAFSEWVPLDAGEYELKIYAQLVGDENPDNDTEIRIINVTTFNADFSSDITQGIVPFEVNFSDLSIGAVTEWLWDFGDGNVSNEQNPTHTYETSGIYTISLTISNSDFSDSVTKINCIRALREAPNIFGIEVGNSWTYQGNGFTSEEEVVSVDQSTFPTTTYIVETRENGSLVEKSWYETTAKQAKLWGGQTDGDMIRFSTGLVMAWYPMKVNDHVKTSAKVTMDGFPGLTLNISLTVDVVAKKTESLSFGELEAFKVRYKLRMWGYGEEETSKFHQWVVPYIGIVKYKDKKLVKRLSDFAIGGGMITSTTDADEDGLKDYEELIIYETNWQETDTDNDGLADGDEVNTYGTDPIDEDSDNDGLKDGDEINTYDTDPTNEDSDNDGLNDGEEVNTYGSDPDDNDSDGDGLDDGYEVAIGTGPTNQDSDGDGMPDGWEDKYRFNPLVDDSADDADGDGYTNLEEYEQGRHPRNAEPDPPVLLLPTDTETDVTLTPHLQAQGFSDSDDDNHAQSRWQISSVEDDFTEESLVLDITSASQLTSFNVPKLMLSINTTYYWRAKYIDDRGAASEWSIPFEFTTTDIDEADPDQDGIPDDQEVNDSSIDFDNNGTPDIYQADMKCVSTDSGEVQCAKAGTNVTFLESFMWIDPDTSADVQYRPDRMPMGLSAFKLEVDQLGDTAEITLYSSSPMPNRWFLCDPFSGWHDFTANAYFSPDSTSVTLVIEDGGDGDCDGVANGIIINASGPAIILSMRLINPNGGETIPSGSTYTIEWDGPAQAVKFKLQYSLNKGEDWETIAKGMVEKTYNWQVPILKKNINKCLMKITGYNASGNKVGADKSDAKFSIEVITLTSPNGGESLTSGNTYKIEWDTYETKKEVSKIKLKYTKNGGKKWKKIGTISSSSSSSYLWTVPAVSVAKNKCMVLVQLKDKKGNNIGSDASDSYFIIQP